MLPSGFGGLGSAHHGYTRYDPRGCFPSGGHAPVRNLCSPVGRSGSSWMSRKSLTPCTALDRARNGGGIRFNPDQPVQCRYCDAKSPLVSGQHAGEELGRHDVAYVTDPFTLKRPFLFSRAKIHLCFPLPTNSTCPYLCLITKHPIPFRPDSSKQVHHNGRSQMGHRHSSCSFHRPGE